MNTGALLAHLGYGATAGAVHRALLRGPGVAASVAYALGDLGEPPTRGGCR